jgi:hypothetical protein
MPEADLSSPMRIELLWSGRSSLHLKRTIGQWRSWSLLFECWLALKGCVTGDADGYASRHKHMPLGMIYIFSSGLFGSFLPVSVETLPFGLAN